MEKLKNLQVIEDEIALFVSKEQIKLILRCLKSYYNFAIQYADNEIYFNYCKKLAHLIFVLDEEYYYKYIVKVEKISSNTIDK